MSFSNVFKALEWKCHVFFSPLFLFLVVEVLVVGEFVLIARPGLSYCLRPLARRRGDLSGVAPRYAQWGAGLV